MVNLKKPDQQQLWAVAQRRRRLSDDAVRKAKELGIGPRSLIKNIPPPSQQWKAPVEDWLIARGLREAPARGGAQKMGQGRGATSRAEETQ